ncbi:hypothetical protein LTR09_012446 [Extremus antarcticus]|uniref:Uncharacterized protein n=1 Tax=Extremus antarcticus TaxID=702011 RepID=A0AAJ0D539_9PEZI|nr:hypothetical protein LTR09_012446 [Extremus antarcticus]
MAAVGDESPLKPGQEVARYQPPSTQRETRSQLDRVARADAGDLQARLDLINIDAAETVLAHRFSRHQPERSILTYLQEPGPGVARYEAASAVLEELAEKTEDSAFESALIFRYIQAHHLWKCHPSPTVHCAEDLIQSLDGHDYIQANIIIGTSAQVAKRNCIGLIDGIWGAEWFDKIPNEMRHPSWGRPEGCSKRMLAQMAAIAKQGFSLEHAVGRSKAAPYLILSDVAALNTITEAGGRGQRTSDRFFPQEVKEDRLKVEVVAPPSTSTKIATPPNYAEGPRSNPTTTRKKRMREEEPEEDKVEEIPETESYQSTSPERGQHDASAQSSRASPSLGGTPQPTPRRRECEGPAFEAGMRKMLDLFSELENPMYTAARCCDRCRGPLQEAVRCLQGYLTPIIDDLEKISTHTFGDDEAPSTQDHGILPLKPRRRHNHLFLLDDSDVDDGAIR